MISPHINGAKFNRLRVEPKQFEKQLKWLKNRGFEGYFLSELVGMDQVPPKAVAITFDDGYEDNFTNAFELLAKYGFKATIFIVVDRLHADWAHDKDIMVSSDELNSEPMLKNEQIKKMIDSGLIEIGSHTLNHANLPALPIDQKRVQIQASKTQIEEQFGIKCESFAYPFGFFDSESLMYAGRTYAASVTTERGIYNPAKHPPYRIPRLMVSGRAGLFAFKLNILKGRVR